MLSKSRLTTLEEMLKRTVRLNGLLVPVKAIESALCNYVHPLVVWNHDETYSVGLIGSGIAIHYRDKYLLLCTRHQLKALAGRSYEDVGLLDKDGHSFCSAGGIRHYLNHLNEVDLHDLVVFDFTEPCQARPYMRERFFNFESLPPDTLSDQIIGFVASGYPVKEQDYGLTEDEKHLGLRRAQVVCSLAPYNEQPKEDPTLLRLTPMDQLRFDPDGMSGGAAFVVQFVNGLPHAYLAGMIVRAGANSLYILKAVFIQKFIEWWLDQN